MIIETASFLSGMARGRLDQTQRFMAECNSSGVTYRISASPDQTIKVDVDILYSAERFANRTPDAVVTLATDHGPAKLKTYLFHGAVGLLTLLADQPVWLKAMRDLDPEMAEQTAWNTFGIDRDAVFRDDLRPMTTGEFIGPQDGRYVYFAVDTHGEVTVEAATDHLALIVFDFAAERAISKYRVDEKFGRFAQFP